MVRREPQAVVDQIRVLLRHALLEPQLQLRQRQRFEGAVRFEERDRPRRLIDLARLNPDEPVLHHVDAADAMLPRERVQPLHQLDRRHVLTIESHRHPVVERDGDVRRLFGRRVERLCPGVHLLGRLHPWVLEDARLHRPPPQVLVRRVRRGDGLLDRDAVPLRVRDRLVPVHQVLARRPHDLQVGPQRPDRHIEAHLVVALAGAPMRHRRRAHLARLVHQQLRNQRPPERRRERIRTLVHRPRRQRRKHEEPQEVLARVHHLDGLRARREPALARGLHVRQPPEVHHQAHDLVPACLLQPLRSHRGVQPPGIRKDDGFSHECSLPGYVSISARRRVSRV